MWHSRHHVWTSHKRLRSFFQKQMETRVYLRTITLKRTVHAHTSQPRICQHLNDWCFLWWTTRKQICVQNDDANLPPFGVACQNRRTNRWSSPAKPPRVRRTNHYNSPSFIKWLSMWKVFTLLQKPPSQKKTPINWDVRTRTWKLEIGLWLLVLGQERTHSVLTTSHPLLLHRNPVIVGRHLWTFHTCTRIDQIKPKLLYNVVEHYSMLH